MIGTNTTEIILIMYMTGSVKHGTEKVSLHCLCLNLELIGCEHTYCLSGSVTYTHRKIEL